MRYTIKSDNRISLCRTVAEVVQKLRDEYLTPDAKLERAVEMLPDGGEISILGTTVTVIRNDAERTVEFEYDGCRQAHVLTVRSEERVVTVILKDGIERLGEEFAAAMEYCK